MTVAEFLKATEMSLHALSQGAGVSYTTLHPHVRHGKPLGLDAAKKLEAYDPRLNAAEILGLTPAPVKRTGTRG